MCRAADILKIPCADQRFMDDLCPWNSWGGERLTSSWSTSSLSMMSMVKELISRDWELPPFFLGNRFPCKKENVYECSIP